MDPEKNNHLLISDPQLNEASGEEDTKIFMKIDYTRENLARSNTLKVEGNEFYKIGNYHMAVSRYDNALQFLSHVMPINGDEEFLIEKLAVSLNSSIAACWFKLNEFELARNQCTSTLKLNVENIEVLYLRALASLNLSLFEDAFIDLQEAHKIEPTNLDVLSELKRVQETHEFEFEKSQAKKGKEICEVSLPLCKGHISFDPLLMEAKDKSLSQSTICSTSKLMEEKKFNPSFNLTNSKMNLTNINMDYKSDHGAVSSSKRLASKGNEKDPVIYDTMNSRTSYPAQEVGVTVEKMFKHYSLRRDSRFFLKICQDDYDKLRWGNVLKYFSSHNMFFMTIRVVNQSSSNLSNGYNQSNSKPTSFISNSLSFNDLCDLGGQESTYFEWDNLVSNKMGIDEDDAFKIDVIEDIGDKSFVSNSAAVDKTIVTSNYLAPQECHQAPFWFTSRSRKCRKHKSRRKCRLHYNTTNGSKRKRVQVVSSEACSPSCKKRASDCIYHLCTLPGIMPNEGSFSGNHGPCQTRQSKALKEFVNSEVQGSEETSKDQVHALENSFLQEEYSKLPSQINDQVNTYAPEGFQTEEGSLVSGISDELEQGISIGQTLKRLLSTSHFAQPLLKHDAEEDLNNDPKFKTQDVEFEKSILTDRGKCLLLEVITGPARGLCYSVRSTDTSKLPLTLGRVRPSDIVVKDPEISGKHATINWNSSKLKWELVDIGSLNGTLLNLKAVHHPDSGSRLSGKPHELVSGDVITLGTSSQISVQITSVSESDVPFGVGIASDPMSMRRGGKKFPMEDVCYYQWPLPGVDQFGVFGICDGHGGALAAKSVSKILPKMVATVLLDSSRREEVLSQHDASDVLTDAISQTEACLNHHYEGCTATVLLVWDDGHSFYAQCANVGDSACVININGKQIKMTEDHRISSYPERQRINETGDPLKDGDTRLCGLNLGRMLGDKFLKEQEARFSSKPYISEVVRIGRASDAFALLASDGLWDVISVKKAIQLVLQAKERYTAHNRESAEKVANFLLDEAKSLRTKDNTSIVYIDFHTAFKTSYS